jgi:hypothetical protein
MNIILKKCKLQYLCKYLIIKALKIIKNNEKIVIREDVCKIIDDDIYESVILYVI